jgi:hypothetical protein
MDPSATQPGLPDVEQAARDMDRAMNDPSRRSDAMGNLFAALGAAAQQAADQRRAAREALRLARKNDPVTRANRSRGSRQGWAKRRAREERERLLASIGDGPVRTGPVCDEMNHNSVGWEVFCQLDPDDGHAWHDDDNGTTWERED